MLNFLLGGKFQLGLVAIVVAVVGYLFWDYQHAKSELVKAKAEVTTLKESYKDLNKAFDTYKSNQETLNTMFAAQRGLVIQQEKVKESIRNVPVKGTAKPFASDPGLLERARKLRDYQKQSAAK